MYVHCAIGLINKEFQAIAISRCFCAHETP